MVKRIFVILLLMIGAATFVFAQNHLVTGIVIDEKSGETIPSIAILLFKMPDSMVYKGTITNNNGEFEMDEVERGNYFLRITYLDYQHKTINIEVGERNIDLGKIYLSQSAQTLDTAVVIGKRKVIKKIDKTVYMIDSSLLANAVTTFDVLQKIPELIVKKSSEEVSVNGNSTYVMINGVLSPIAAKIKTIDPHDLEKVEVITNPSSEYGEEIHNIVNIVLKSELKKGYTLYIANYYLPYTKFEANPFLQYNWKKIRYVAYYNYARFSWVPKDTTYRKVVENNTIEEYSSLIEVKKRVEQSHMISNRVDYYINTWNFVNLSAQNTWIPRVENGTNYSVSTIPSYGSQISNIKTDATQKIFTGNYALFYKKTFADETHYLTSSFSFHHMNAEYKRDYNETSNNEQRADIENAERYSYNLKTDYYLPISEKFSLNTGVLGYYQLFHNKYITNNITDYKYSNLRAHYYADLQWQLGAFYFRWGNKLEGYFTYKDSETGAKITKYLPSLSVLAKVDNYNTIRLNYRSVNIYPSVWTLVPYTIFSADSATITKGNPNLLPQTQHSFSLQHSYNKGSTMIKTQLYLNYLQNAISYRRIVVAQNRQLIEPQNETDKFTWGANINAIFPISEKWNLNINLLPYYEYFKSDKSCTNLSSNIVFNTTIQLPLEIELEANFTFNGKRLILQGYYKSNPDTDISLYKSFSNSGIDLLVGYSGFFIPQDVIVFDNANTYEWNKSTSTFRGMYVRISYTFRKGKKVDVEQIEQFVDNDIKR